MEEVLSIVMGVLVIIIGALVYAYNSKVAKFFQVGYDQSKNRYDERSSKAKGIGKVLTFLLFKPKTYYENETATKNVLKLLFLLLIYMGVIMILLGFGVIR